MGNVINDKQNLGYSVLQRKKKIFLETTAEDKLRLLPRKLENYGESFLSSDKKRYGANNTNYSWFHSHLFVRIFKNIQLSY